jgi:hypothetical protein
MTVCQHKIKLATGPEETFSVPHILLKTFHTFSLAGFSLSHRL